MTVTNNNEKQYNIFIQVFARVWAFWGLVSFIGTFLIILIPSMISHLMPYKKGQDYFMIVSKIWMRIWLTLIACPLKVKGLENFKKGESYVVTSNHNSFLDIPLSCPFIPAGNKTIGKASFNKIPLFNFFYSRGAILVNRNSDASRRKSFEEMRRFLAMGIHIGIYPEGTRNRTGEPLKAFYDGAFKLAVDNKTSIIPCIIYNTAKALPTTKSFFLLPTVLHIHFLPAISSLEKTTAQLKQEVFDVMYNQLVEHHP